jgi:hypothetical protein
VIVAERRTHGRRAGVVDEIAARRRADVAAELSALDRGRASAAPHR